MYIVCYCNLHHTLFTTLWFNTAQILQTTINRQIRNILPLKIHTSALVSLPEMGVTGRGLKDLNQNTLKLIPWQMPIPLKPVLTWVGSSGSFTFNQLLQFPQTIRSSEGLDKSFQLTPNKLIQNLHALHASRLLSSTKANASKSFKCFDLSTYLSTVSTMYSKKIILLGKENNFP